MTVIRPNSISGVSSITGSGGDISIFRADGTPADVTVNNITSGIITATHYGSGANLTNLPAGNLTGAISAANLTSIPAGNLTGTIADARFPSTLPAIDGSNLTGVGASFGNSSVNTSGIITATAFVPTTGQLSHRNIIINGNMTIHQRGGTITFSEAGYSLDRWKMRTGNHSGAANITQETTSPDGFQKSLKVQVTTADNSLTGGEYFFVTQYVESNNIHHAAYGNSGAKTMTLSFYVRSNVTGTYNCAFYVPSSAKLFSKSYTISAQDTWERKTITIPGDTSGGLGTGTGTGMRVEWYLAAGTSYTSGSNQATWSSYSVGDTAPNNVNLLHSVSNNFYLTGVQLEIGSVATPFEHRSYADELIRCMRYYQTSTDDWHSALNSNSTPSAYSNCNVPFKVQMRAAPTVNYVWTGNGGNTPASQSTNYIGVNSFVALSLANSSSAFRLDSWNCSAEL